MVIKIHHLSNRIFIILLAVILTTALIFFVLFYQKSLNIAREEFSNNMQLTLGQINTYISSKLLGICELQKMITTDESVIQYLSADFETETLYQQFAQFKELTALMSRLYINKDVYKVTLYVDDNKLYADQFDDFYPISLLQNTPIYEEVAKNPAQVVWGEPYRSTRSDVQVIPCYKGIINIDNFQHISGICVIELPVSLLHTTISQTNISQSNNMVVLSESGSVLTANSLQDTEIYTAQMAAQVTAEGGVHRSNAKTLLFSSRLSGAPWYLLVGFQDDNIIRSSRIFTFFATISIFILLIIVVISVTMAVQSHSRLYILKQIQHINQTIEASNHIPGTASGALPKKDLDKLSAQVTALIETVKHQLSLLYENEIRLREEQLNALQAQINPHFLYNTLDTINWMAIRLDAKNISYMLERLSLYFRLSLNNGRDLVPLRDEIHLVQSYVDIQRVRFDDRFHLECQLDPALLEIEIPKLSLQPFVENSIIHGFLNQRQAHCQVIINASVQKGLVNLRIVDNGVGMVPEHTQELNQLLTGQTLPLATNLSRPSGNHYGILNVYDRFKIYTHGQVKMQITSQGKGLGTTVSLQFPLDSGNTT